MNPIIPNSFRVFGRNRDLDFLLINIQKTEIENNSRTRKHDNSDNKYNHVRTHGARKTTVVWLSSRSGCKKSLKNDVTLSSVMWPATITCLEGNEEMIWYNTERNKRIENVVSANGCFRVMFQRSYLFICSLLIHLIYFMSCAIVWE